MVHSACNESRLYVKLFLWNSFSLFLRSLCLCFLFLASVDGNNGDMKSFVKIIDLVFVFRIKTVNSMVVFEF